MRKCFLAFYVVSNLIATHHEIDRLVEDLRCLTEVPGAAVGIIIDDEILLAKGYGMRNEKDPVTIKTLFPIGSGSKAFTSFLIGQLQNEGLLHWDDPVSNHIPYFKLKDPYTTYNITIRDYLAHISGYPRHEAIWFNEQFSRKDLIQRLRFLEPLHALREKFLYQNLGYLVAGHVAELATGKNYEELVTEKILKPLGMNNSTFSLIDMQKKDNFSLGYRNSSEPIPFVDPTTIAPAGGLNSNVEDLLRWLKLLLNKGEGLIESSTFEEMITPQVISNLIRNGRYGVENEILAESYGLGWILISYRGHFVSFHGGNIDGFSSTITFLPNEGIGIVILCNKHLSPFAPLLTTLLLDKLLHLPPVDWAKKYNDLAQYTQEEFVRNQEISPKQKPLGIIPSHPISDYKGTYIHPGYGSLDIYLTQDKLVATFNKMSLPLEHWNYNVFEVSNKAVMPIVQGIKFSFQENFYGDISSLIVPLEPQGKGIIFMKQQDPLIFQKEYLDQFVGKYSYLGLTFVIENTEDKLTVKAFGQPPYELTPEKPHLFKVKGLDGYTVQFINNDLNVITAVRLIQPNNSVYTANKL